MILLQSGVGIFSFFPAGIQVMPGLCSSRLPPALRKALSLAKSLVLQRKLFGHGQRPQQGFHGGLYSPFDSFDLVLLLGLVVGIVLTFRFARQVTLRGWGPTLQRLLLQAFHSSRAPQPRSRSGQSRSQPSHDLRFEAVSQLVQKLPVEEFMSAEGLRKLPAKQLKAQLRTHGVMVRPGESMDKEDIVSRLMDLRNSSACKCSVCCEEYHEGDVLRRLSCNHKFHVECIDRWFLGSTDRSEKPCCPMCNASLAAHGQR